MNRENCVHSFMKMCVIFTQTTIRSIVSGFRAKKVVINFHLLKWLTSADVYDDYLNHSSNRNVADEKIIINKPTHHINCLEKIGPKSES